MGKFARGKLAFVLIAALVVVAFARTLVTTVEVSDAAVGLHVSIHETAGEGHHHHDHDQSSLPECLEQCVDGSPDAFLLAKAAATHLSPDTKFDHKLIPHSWIEASIRVVSKASRARGPPGPQFDPYASGSRIVILRSARFRI